MFDCIYFVIYVFYRLVRGLCFLIFSLIEELVALCGGNTTNQAIIVVVLLSASQDMTRKFHDNRGNTQILIIS